MKTYRVIELFSGVGAQRMALDRLASAHPDKVRFEFVAQCDIDQHSIDSYNKIHGDTPNLGDIAKVETLPDCDILTWSFPCQDLSQAGNKQGMEEGSCTRSALCWEVVRLVRDAMHRPEWLVMENVPAILYKDNKPEFLRLVGQLADLGYQNQYGILNAVDFDVAQNRKRCFMVSHYNSPAPELPKGKGLEHKLKDYLEENVDERYYLSKERLNGLIVSSKTQKEKGRGFGFSLSSEEGAAKTITTREGSRHTNNFIGESPIQVAKIPLIHYESRSKVFSTEGTCPTIGAHDVSHTPKILERRE